MNINDGLQELKDKMEKNNPLKKAEELRQHTQKKTESFEEKNSNAFFKKFKNSLDNEKLIYFIAFLVVFILLSPYFLPAILLILNS